MDDEFTECFVYIICHVKDGEDVGPVKIGMSDRPEYRLGNLRSGNPSRIRLYKKISAPNRDYALFLEGGFHAMLVSRKLQGEWFDLEPKEAMGLMAVNYIFFLSSMGVQGEQRKEIMKNLGFEDDGA